MRDPLTDKRGEDLECHYCKLFIYEQGVHIGARQFCDRDHSEAWLLGEWIRLRTKVMGLEEQLGDSRQCR